MQQPIRRRSQPSSAVKGSWLRIWRSLLSLLLLALTEAFPIAASMVPLTAHAADASGSWVTQSSPDVTSNNVLLAVTCLGAVNCWAVGFAQTSQANSGPAVIEHYTGNGWSVSATPSPGAYQNNLDGIACVAADNCWAVGYATTSDPGIPLALIEHYDGSSWTQVSSSIPDSQTTWLTGIACVGASDCWAVGFYDDGSGNNLIVHYDGTGWSVVPSPNPHRYDDLYGVTCLAANDCWAVGDGFEATSSVILHFDGTNWIAAASPSFGSGSGTTLRGVACAASNSCWAVGRLDSNNELIEHYDGNTWTVSTTPPNSSGEQRFLMSVACDSATRCWAVGLHNGSGLGLYEVWSGQTWSVVAGPTTGGNSELYGVSCSGPSACSSAGDSSNGYIRHTLVERFSTGPPPAGTIAIVSPVTNGVLADGSSISVQANPGSSVSCLTVYVDSTSHQLGYTCPGASQGGNTSGGTYTIAPSSSLTYYAGTHVLIATLSESDGTTDTSAAVPVVIDPGQFKGVTPYRELDTRDGTGAYKVGSNYGPVTPVPPNETLQLAVTGGGVPASGVSAVVLNVTVADATQSGFVTAYPDGQSRPIASNLNFSASQVVANLVTVGSSNGGFNVDLYNGSSGSTDMVADVVGYYTDGSGDEQDGAGRLHGVVPTRVLDTRDGTGGVMGAIRSAGSISFPVTGRGGVPSSGVAGVVLNLTETDAHAQGYFTSYPTDSGQPLASSLNFQPGQTVPNLVVLPLGPSGRVSVYNGSDGTTDAVADVVGYFTDSTAPISLTGLYTPLLPARVLDTRYGRGAPPSPLDPGMSLPLVVTGVGGVPSAGVSSILLNVTVTDTQGGGYLTVYPGDATQPLASNLNFVAGQTVPNLVTSAVSQSGAVNVYNGSGGRADVVADVQGFYS